MNILRQLTVNGRASRDNRVRISVTYYVPCTDTDREAYGLRGQYQTVTGICRKVDPDVSRCLHLDDLKIRFRDICQIESNVGIFDEIYET